MSLVLPSCFKGLSREDQLQQIYEAIIGAAAGGSGEITISNSLFVTEEGDDATAERERLDLPYSSPEAAQAAAQAGDTIYVYSGTYAIAGSLGAHDVHWQLLGDVLFSRTGMNAADDAMWDDNNTAMSFSVEGGDFHIEGTGNPIHLLRQRHASSNIIFNCRNVTGTGNSSYAFTCEGGIQNVTLNTAILAGVSAGCVWWKNGTQTVHGRKLESAYAIDSAVSAVPTGDLYIDVDDIDGLVQNTGTNALAAMWIFCKTVRVSSADYQAISAGAGRNYVFAEKIFGTVTANDGLLYVTAQKISATQNNQFLVQIGNSAAEAYIEIAHYDPSTFTGVAPLSGGGAKVHINGMRYVANSSGTGISPPYNSGTVYLHDCLVDMRATGAAPIDYAAAQLGGVIVLDHCTLLARLALAEITRVQTVEDSGSSLQELGFIIYDDVGSVGVWINVSGSGSIPGWASGAARAIEVTISTDDPADVVAQAIQAAVDADAKFIATDAGNVVTITSSSTGVRSDVEDQTSGNFQYGVLQQGTAGATVNSIESTSTLPATVIAKSSYANTVVDAQITISPTDGLIQDAAVR